MLPIGAAYYRVKGKLACTSCAEKAKMALPQVSHSGFMRALLFGIGGAILGLAIYSTFAILTGLVIGYVSLAVGFIVGKAVRMGAGGLGGRRYQITAALLTYAAVSMSAIPIGIYYYEKSHPVQSELTAQPSASSANTAQSGDASSDDRPNLGAALLSMAFAGLASPFLGLEDPIHGIIGLVILFVGIRIAWQMTGGKPSDDIIGPFRNAPAPTAPTSS
jgi:hypothetical protein